MWEKYLQIQLLIFFVLVIPAEGQCSLITDALGVTQTEITDKLGITKDLQSLASALQSSVALGMDSRSFEPATTLGTSLGIDLGLDVVVSKPNGNVEWLLARISGNSSSDYSMLILPSLLLRLNKGLSENVEIGASYLPAMNLKYIGGSSALGFEGKFVIFRPAEGPVWAVRLSYMNNEFILKYSPLQVKVNTTTMTPQLIISQPFGWANPYLGGAFQYSTGTVNGELLIPQLIADPIELTANSATSTAVYFFGGLTMKVPLIGAKIAIEGGYYPNGMDYIGAKVGLEF